MRRDENNQWIGAGEDTAYAFLGYAFALPGRKNRYWPARGIYRQFPFLDLIKPKIKQEIKFSPEYKKQTVDLVINTGKETVAIYVNGKDHNGQVKSNRDQNLYYYLEKSKIKITVLRKSECKILFQEKLNYLSILEICNGLKTAGVKT